jgi:hypothetical protein
MKRDRTVSRLLLLGLTIVSLGGVSATAQFSSRSFIGSLNNISTLTSTIPVNGDVNPYGVALVPRTTGKLVEGQFLVSNFNNNTNQQGTGTTIVEISPGGSLSLFAQINPATTNCPGGVEDGVYFVDDSNTFNLLN